MIFRTSFSVDFEKRCEKPDLENARSGFLEEFYLETQWKPTLLGKTLKKRVKQCRTAQKGKDLPIGTGSDGQRSRNSRNNSCYSCRLRRQGCRLGPPESVKSCSELRKRAEKSIKQLFSALFYSFAPPSEIQTPAPCSAISRQPARK